MACNKKYVASDLKTQLVLDEKLHIPDEFLDSITYEVMSLPMVLPSGKVVDQSTIDKHGKIEESYGRMLSDPFTAQPFTLDRKPVFDALLKSNIDKFLLKNQNSLEIKNIPRTVGKSLQRTQVPHCSKRLKIDEIRQEVIINNSLTLDKRENIANQSSSLEDAVQNALIKITRFSQVKKYDEKKLIINCVNCNTTDLLYKINLCNHFICRNCLLKTNLTKCSNCHLIFEKKDVIRYHS